MTALHKVLLSTAEPVTGDHDGDPVFISKDRCMIDRRRETDQADSQYTEDDITIHPDAKRKLMMLIYNRRLTTNEDQNERQEIC